MRVLSGIQPSGGLHIGNYFGAVRQFLRYQDDTSEALYFVADLHALTSVRDGPKLRQASLDLVLDYLALGLDPARAIVFRHADIPEIPALAWILGTVTPVALMERAHSYKDKIAKGMAPDIGLFTYPILMAADILLYGSDAVPVGKDQKQHLEFCRDIATKFNIAYVPGYDPQDPNGKKSGVPGILKLPEPLILDEVAEIPGVDGQKMSKSYGNALEVFAPDEVVKKTIMSVKTDSTPVEAPKPVPSTLLRWLTLMCEPAEAAEHLRTWSQGGVGYGTYKKRLVERFHEMFGPARRKRVELVKRPDYLSEVLRDGATRARALADPIWTRVLAATGVGKL